MFLETPSAYEILVPLNAEIGLLVLLLIVVAADLYATAEQRRGVGVLSAVGMLAISVMTVFIGLSEVSNPAFEAPVIGGMVTYDMLGVIFKTMVIIAAALTCLLTLDVPRLGRLGEFYAVVIAATIGMCLMASAADLIMIFLALETTSISLYVLAGILRGSQASAEAGIKYFLFGSFTTGILLYGFSLLYGFTGSTNIYSLAEPLSDLLAQGPSGAFALIVALLFFMVAIGFKISAVPFHFWTPDVYQGAPTPVTAFISTASKAASFALMIRFFSVTWPPEAQVFWLSLIAAIAAITMTFGNVLALVQSNIKRMLAYSSIAQAGYTLIGLVALTETELGAAAIAFYMFMYVLTNIAAFGVVVVVSNVTGKEEIADFAGLNKRSPLLTLALVLALLSLAGVPPLAGFFGKFFLFSAAIEAGYIWLAILGVLNSIVALYYYLTIVKVMYVDVNEDMRPVPVSQTYGVVLFLTCGGIIFLGTLAGPLWGWALDAARTFVALAP